MNETIISKYQEPSLVGLTGTQPSSWSGYNQARDNVAIFSAIQMKSATRN